MDVNPLKSRPAPQGIVAKDGLQELHAMLDRLLAKPTPTTTAQSAEVLLPTACTLLRQRLAVRGWVSPRELMPGMEESDVADALRIVGQEVEVAERLRFGQWFMTLGARKRVFASINLPSLRQATERIHDADDSDPVRLALLFALEAGLPESPSHTALVLKLESLPDAVLRELALMHAWGSAVPGLETLAAAASARLRRRIRDRDLDTLAVTPIFGREIEFQRIRDFLAQPAMGMVRALYVSGIGGTGKSTLLLAAEKELRQSGNALPVRMDFDNAGLDPRNPEGMDVMFLRALAVEEPSFAPAMQPIILQLQSLAEHRMRSRVDAEAESDSSARSEVARENRKRRMARSTQYASGSGSDAERAGISEGYERLSALDPLRFMPELRQRAVILFLDTVENVTRVGADAIESLLEWLLSLSDWLPSDGLHVMLAGRDRLGEPSMLALAKRFQDHGLALETEREVVLGDLEPEVARKVLEYHGMPADDAHLASEALPRNPLVLRLAASAYQASKDDLAEIQQDYRAGRIDRWTASGYLAQRVIQHVPGLPARRYAVAALALDSVTERWLRDIVIPAVDGVEVVDRKLARKVYEGLQRATWLTSEEKPGTLRWHTELRNLALPMIEADVGHAEVNRRVHSAAEVWHVKQRSDLADHYRNRAPVNANPLRKADDYVHRMQLEGVGGLAGEGDRLVAQGRGARALELYRERPTRAPGAPPTFVVRAMAQTGDWENHDVDPDLVLEELRRHIKARSGMMQRAMIERLYWLTRLEMLRETELGRAHVAVLRDACRGLKFNKFNGTLFGLVGTEEALQSTIDNWSPIAPADLPPPRADLGPEIRFSMVRTVFGRTRFREAREGWVQTNLGAVLTFDETWLKTLYQFLHSGLIDIEGGRLDWLKSRLRELRAAPLVEVERFVSACREVPLSINLLECPPDAAYALLRGTLVEFHSPLSTLLSAPALRLSQRDLLKFVESLPLPESAVVTLPEYGSADTREARERNLLPTITAVIVAMDRARVLGEFCGSLVRDPTRLLSSEDSHPVQRVLDLCHRYLAWDRALDPETPLKP